MTTTVPTCPDCGRVNPCPRCRIAARLANPHNDPQFRSGAKPCRCCGQWITEHDLVDGAFVCQKETTT